MSLEKIIEIMSAHNMEEGWLRDFRQRNLENFRSLVWEKGKYTSLEIKDEELELKPLVNAFSAVSSGAEFEGIFDATRKRDIRKYFAVEKDKISSLNNALFNSGFFLYVPDNAKAEARISFDSDSKCLARCFIVLGKGSKLNVVQNIASNPGLLGINLDMHAGQDSEIRISTLQNLGQDTTAVLRQRAFLGRDSKLKWTNGTLGGKVVRSGRDMHLEGQGANADDTEIFFGNDEQVFELHTTIVHKVHNTRGHSSTKGILGGSSRVLTQGLARIEKGADGSDSYLAEHVLLVSPGAKAEPMPFMEIKANDVKAKHSGFVSPVDEEKVFYLNTRGLENNEARKSIALSFLEPAVAGAGLIQDELRSIIESKWKL